MKLSEFSVKNPLLINSLTIFIVIVGFLCFIDLEREAFPNFSFDIVSVRTNYLGAASDVIEKRITIPLEKEIRKVSDLDEVGSISLEGMSLIVIQLNPDAKDKDRIINDIERAVEEAEKLPDDLDDQTTVKELKTKNTPIVEVALYGDLPYDQLRKLALDLEDEILDLPGVASIARKGLRDKEIWVEVNPQKANDDNIALSQVIEALALQNVNIPGGLLKTEQSEFIIRINGEFVGTQEVKNVIIRANDAGNWVQVKDVAKVTDQFADIAITQRTDGKASINLQIIKEDKADLIRVRNSIQKLLDNFISKNEPRLKYALVDDLSYYIKRRLNVLTSNGWIGLILVIIPLVLFLSFRVAIGAALGMPIAILTAIIAMKFFGISINLISMFGMIMVLGMLVDEDIVVSENITRHLEMGHSPEKAAILGAAEVSPALFSVVATTIIAFIPLLMMSGIFGKFISDIPKVVMITLFASLLEALIILPSHISNLTSRFKEGQKTFIKKIKQHALFNRVKNAYIRSLGHCLERPWRTTLISMVVVITSVLYGIYGIKFILFPSKGIEAFFVRAKTSVGTRLEVTEKLMLPLEEMISSLPDKELDHYVTEVGITQNDPNDPFTTRGSHVAQIRVYLTPETKRKRSSDDIIADLRKHVQKFPGFKEISFDAVKPGPPVGMPVAVRIRGDNYIVMNQIAQTYVEALQKIKGVTDIHNNFEMGKKELNVDVNYPMALQAGLTLSDIALSVQQAFNGTEATKIKNTDEETAIIVRYPEEKRYDRESLLNLEISNHKGGMIPLHKIATLREQEGLRVIRHTDYKRVITVAANINEKITTSGIVNKQLKKMFQDIEKKYPEFKITYGGEEEDTAQSLSSLFRAAVAAMLLIFFVLLLTFGSLKQTLILMLMIPCGFVGIVIAFTLHGEPLTFLALLGMVGLTGVVVDGGTLIFLFINQSRKKGVELKQAVLEGCEVRFRPIFLTTLTTVLGVLPAAYGIGGSDPFIRPMALALNWGLGISIFFTLYFIPVIYYQVENMQAKLVRYLKRT